MVKVLSQFSPGVNSRTVQTANSEAGQTEILSLKATVLLCQECVPGLQSFWHLFRRGKKCLGNVFGMCQTVLAQYSDNSSLFLIIELSLKQKIHWIICSLRNTNKHFLKCSHILNIKVIFKCSGSLLVKTSFLSLPEVLGRGQARSWAHVGSGMPAD